MSSLLSAILAAATLATFPLGSAPSYPEEVEVHTVRGEHVTLITATVPEAKTNIIPGQTARWGVGVHVNAPSAGTISAGLSVSGDFPWRPASTRVRRPGRLLPPARVPSRRSAPQTWRR